MKEPRRNSLGIETQAGKSFRNLNTVAEKAIPIFPLLIAVSTCSEAESGLYHLRAEHGVLRLQTAGKVSSKIMVQANQQPVRRPTCVPEDMARAQVGLPKKLIGKLRDPKDKRETHLSLSQHGQINTREEHGHPGGCEAGGQLRERWEVLQSVSPRHASVIRHPDKTTAPSAHTDV